MKHDTKYPAEVLLQSKALAGYQKDFARAVLAGREHTLQEAKAALDQFFHGKVK